MMALLEFVDDEEWAGNITLVTRDQWNARDPQPRTELLAVIPKMVVLAHTAGRTCPTDKISCKYIVRMIQAGHISLGWDDIAYNFLVGGDGLVYTGVGWNREGHHSLERNNNKSIAIAFIGNYNNVEPTPGQMAAATAVVSVGILLGKLDPDVYVVFQGQIRPFSSPGSHVEKPVKQKWPQWSPLGDIDVEPPQNFTVRFFNRTSWFATDPTTPLIKQITSPLHSVIVYYTETFYTSQRNSVKTMIELQHFYKNQSFPDVPANFLISADGCIFEGRGWDYTSEPPSTRFDNSSLKFVLRIELITFQDSSHNFTSEMNKSLSLLLDESVELGKLVSNYKMYEYDSLAKYRHWLIPQP